MKIVHLSDLHLSNRHQQKNIRGTEKLLQIIQNKNIDHLIISGDISENADPDDFFIMRVLLEKYGFYDTSKTSMVIGNHDIFGGVHLATDIITFPQKCRETPYFEKVQYFYDVFKKLFENTVQPDDNFPFPYAKDLGEIVLIGIDTNMKYSWWANPLASNGYVSNGQIKHLQSLLKNTLFKNKQRLVISHHHFYNNPSKEKQAGFFLWRMIESLTIQLHNRRRLVRLFVKNNIDMVLHGHLHANYTIAKKGIIFANGGGVMESDFKEEQSKINIITITGDQPLVTTEKWQLNLLEEKEALISFPTLSPI